MNTKKGVIRVLVKVRGGYDIHYRNSLFKSGSIIDMDDETYRRKHHLLEVVVSEKNKESEAVVEPEVTAEAVMDMQSHRAIVKPTRTRVKK